MSKLPWFAWYPADFERKTGHLSNEVVGAYVRLMNHYWSNNGQINFDPADLCRIMRTERRRFNHIWRYLNTFFVLQSGEDGDTLLLPRLQEELEKAIEISKTKAESGRKGGLASAEAKKKHTLTHTHITYNNKEKSREKQPRKKRASQLTDDWKLPDDYREYCTTKRPELNPDDVAENFLDYYLSVGKAMVDWKRTWQRWVRNERASNKVSNKIPREDTALEGFAIANGLHEKGKAPQTIQNNYQYRQWIEARLKEQA